jgi:ABC-type dipeptide/oligopeptide/nickel transport system permease subunit
MFSHALRKLPNSKARRRSVLIMWLRRDKIAAASLLFIFLIIVVSILAPFISPDDPVRIDLISRYAPLGTHGHVLGTDGMGRDIASRLIWGGRFSLVVGIVPVLLATLLGMALGMAAGYLGGKADTVIMRILDVLFAFPMVLLALFLVGIAGPGLFSVLIALTVVMIPYVSRVARTATVSERSMDYVLAAQASGVRTHRLLMEELLPNVIPHILTYSTALIGVGIVVGAGLSFLGLGVQPPACDWGIMIADGQQVIQRAPHVTIIPGLVLVGVAVAFSLLGDGLRDLLDPRLKA